ncbi:hypothetical protein GCM10017562_36470 [Streptomyces roseofulvus]|uniref:hypothetical protein n=1 Tax=Streptomyces roseofulvus TaxID=33902 RepID=UPI0031FCC023
MNLTGLHRRLLGDVLAAGDLEELQAKLAGAVWIDDDEFTAHGLDEQRIQELRAWAQRWADDIGERLLEGADPVDDDGLRPPPAPAYGPAALRARRPTGPPPYGPVALRARRPTGPPVPSGPPPCPRGRCRRRRR